MNENSQNQPEQELDTPPKLVAALKDVSRREIFVPPYIDNAIQKAARQHFGQDAKTRRLKFRPWVLWPALATACVLIVCVTHLVITGHPHYAREDLNHDGKVDILDSFALARALKSGQPLPGYDTNDVLLIARHAVQLNKGNGS